MSEFLDFSSQIDGDISRYERLLADVKKVAHLPIPDGFTDGNPVAKIEGVLSDLRSLRNSLKVRSARRS